MAPSAKNGCRSPIYAMVLCLVELLAGIECSSSQHTAIQVALAFSTSH